MRLLRTLLLATAALLAIAACNGNVSSGGDNAMNITVQGSAGYRERILPPPGAKLKVRLENISRADVAAEVLAEQVIELSDRSVPADYKLVVPADQVKAGNTYAVRAEIRGADDRLLWTTDTVNPVALDNAEQTLPPLTLVKVGRGNSAAGQPPGLVGTTWRVTDLHGAGVVDNSQTTILFSDDGRVSGTAGCNLFSGTYSTNNGTFSFGPLAVTQRACIPSLGDQEQKFLDLFGKVDRYVFDATGNLVLKTTDGRTLRAQAS